jgi:pimeloyl-ACP methyl ester carboxylesterase
MTTRAEAYVLIHGAHHGAWVWDSLIEHLHLPAIALDLPGRHDPNVLRGLTVSDCATAVTAEIRSIGLDRVVIVGHSLAGSVAYAVAAQQPDMVVALVGVAALFPPPGRCALDMWPKTLRWLPKSGLALRWGGPSAPVRLRPSQARRRLANDLSPEQASWLLDRLGPEAVGLTTSPVPSIPLEPDLPKTYIVCSKDQALRPSRQYRQARSIAARVVEIAAGHDPMLGATHALATVLDNLPETKPDTRRGAETHP